MRIFGRIFHLYNPNKTSMTRLFKKLTIALCLLLCVPHALADTYIKREVRAVWMATVWALDFPTTTGTSASAQSMQKREMTDYLDRLKADNFNTVYFQVRSMCDAFYPSSYEPWSSYLTGERGADPGWDPLAFVVEECHKRGMECYAWVNPYRWSTGSDWDTPQDQDLKNSGLLLSHGSTTILNPGLPAARQRIVNVCKEITVNYDIDGIVFDDYFYPNGIPTNSTAGDYNLWQSSGTSLSFGDWRRANVNQMVADVYNMIQSTKPYVKFGISPAGAACTSESVASKYGIEPCPVASDWQYNGIFSDPVAWLYEGTIDFISPQLYWKTTHSTNPFGPMTDWWSYVANHFGRHHYASHSISHLLDSNNTYEWAEVGKQLQYSRDYTENAAPGEVYYSAAYITGKKAEGLGEWLLENKYQRPALTPAIDWKKADHYDKVTNLQKSGTTLTWDEVEGMRYTIYAFPVGTPVSSIQSTVTDGGIASEYLLDVSYAPEYTLPDEYEFGYNFAVCILDRYGNEFAPRYTNESTVPADKADLLSPIDGAGVKLTAEFKWTAAENATYVLYVATDADFRNLVLETGALTEASYTADVTDFARNSTFYWRVITMQPDRYDVVSDTETFTTLPYDPAESATLVAPANGSEITDLVNVNFSWNAVEGCTYTLQVASDEAMTDIVASKTTDGTSLTIPTATIGYSSTRYWRVATDRRGASTGYSDVWSFTTPYVPTAPATTLLAPADGATIDDNFFFEFQRVDADNYAIQVSRTSDFSEIETEITSGYEIEGNIVRRATALTFIPEGTYYWRVASLKDGYEPSYTAARSFTIDNSIESGSGIEEGYRLVQDGNDYQFVDGLQLNNLWIRSVKPEFGNIRFDSNGSFNRSFCVLENVIYISGRIDNSASAQCYIDKYDALTGAKIGRVMLDDNAQCSYYPCNDIFKDGAKNIGIANLTLNVSSTPLRILSVDTETGETTLCVECTSAEGGRIDHCAVTGNITTGSFTVFAAVSGSNKILKWKFQGFAEIEHTTLTVGDLYPEADNFGIAPRVFINTASSIFVNGGSIAPMHVNGTTGDVADSFANNAELTPEGLNNNGFATFKFDNEYFMVYPTGDHETANGFTFMVAKTDSQREFSAMQPLWTIPQTGIGSVYSTTLDALVDYEIIRTGRVELSGNIYIYVPGNGLAAYSIFSRPVSGIDNLETEIDNTAIVYANGTIRTTNIAERIEVYNLSGALVSFAENTDAVRLDAPKGVYIVRAVTDGRSTVKKIIAE